MADYYQHLPTDRCRSCDADTLTPASRVTNLFGQHTWLGGVARPVSAMAPGL